MDSGATTPYEDPSKESTFEVKTTSRRSTVIVTTDGAGFVSREESTALTELANWLGTTEALTLGTPQLAVWGTTLTDGWHRRYRAVLVVHRHLHIPGTLWRDGVRFEEDSAGERVDGRRTQPSEILPIP